MTTIASHYQLFYLKDCPYCQAFLERLQQCPQLDQEILKIDVDELRSGGQKVEGLRVVPTLVDGQKVHEGTRATAWLADKLRVRTHGLNDTKLAI